MSSIIRDGDTYHGISVFGRGVFTDDEHSRTYAGQHRDGYACGLGVLTRWSRGGWNGDKYYAEHGPDGEYDGRYMFRYTDETTGYMLFKEGPYDRALVRADGSCVYNGEDCAPDDPCLLALIARVAPVEVHPAAPAPTRHRPPLAPKQSSDAPARFAPAGARDRRGHRGAHPRRTLALVAVRHKSTTAALHSTTTQ
jgi:hypothetical protein